MSTVRTLLGLWRRHGPQWLASAADPHAELLTLVWGPQFDHLYARQRLALSAAGPAVDPPARFALWQVGVLFDQLPPVAQQRLRQIILRHRALSTVAQPWGTMPHGPHPAH